MDQGLWDQTIEIATTQIPEMQGVEIPDSSFTTEFAEAAAAALEADGVDVMGADWERIEVELNQGGE